MYKKKHGMSGTKMYQKWADMKHRCENKSAKSYHNYGGRGIKVCDEWVNSFKTFMEWSLENGHSDDLQLDRINNDLGYSPDNCRYVTYVENLNNRRNTTFCEINGVTKPLTVWAKENGLSRYTVRGRYKKGIRGMDLIKEARDKNAKRGGNKRREILSSHIKTADNN